MNETPRTETVEKPSIGAQVWPDQYEWLQAKANAGVRPRKMSDVIREIIDDAMHAENERMSANA